MKKGNFIYKEVGISPNFFHIIKEKSSIVKNESRL